MSYQLIAILVLYVLLANIIWPAVIATGEFNKKVVKYMTDNNITSPACFTRYLVNVSHSLLKLNVEVGIDSNGFFTQCDVTPAAYHKCSALDYANALHPCSFVRAAFRTFVI